ncbi:COX15/CtaA family protein [Thermocoleostomius sinensis]|uniref:Heme A synthase n=1 Tax=Thermocoleostomius sinensis A174 TaxID=2016057 RepID=A0A9E9C9Z2_9CYAN|nr:heme A synthase [Thermocoleostomius sinensis]WAL62178.1 heme A synthase [Thermocoleostomius sinensis A174]
MADSSMHPTVFNSNSSSGSTAIAASTASSAQTLVRRLVWKIALATFILMAIGSATRVMNAGLACPDWPLCYGTLFPSQQMNLQVFLEWFHRLDAALIGLMTIALVILCWWRRRELPAWTPWVALLALGLIVFQGVLGGLTVTELLRFDIVTAHLGTALLFFSTLLVMGVLLLPYKATGTAAKLPWIGAVAIGLIYLQSLSGALVGSRWALHQCLFGSQLCSVMNVHLFGVVPASLATLLVVVWAWRTPALSMALRQLAKTAGLLLLLQVILGVSTFRLHLQVELLTVAHQAVGAALLGTLLCFTVLAWRDRRLAPIVTGVV